MPNVQVTTMLSAVIATGVSPRFFTSGQHMSFQAFGQTSAGAGSSTIDPEASLDGTNFFSLGTITLTLSTTTSSDGFAITAPYRFLRANVTAISGTDATVTVLMGGNPV